MAGERGMGTLFQGSPAHSNATSVPARPAARRSVAPAPSPASVRHAARPAVEPGSRPPSGGRRHRHRCGRRRRHHRAEKLRLNAAQTAPAQAGQFFEMCHPPAYGGMSRGAWEHGGRGNLQRSAPAKGPTGGEGTPSGSSGDGSCPAQPAHPGPPLAWPVRQGGGVPCHRPVRPFHGRAAFDPYRPTFATPPAHARAPLPPVPGQDGTSTASAMHRSAASTAAALHRGGEMIQYRIGRTCCSSAP